MSNRLNLKVSKSQIVKELKNMHAVDIAKELYEVNDEQRELITQILPLDMIDDVFIELEDDQVINFFNDLDVVRKRHLIQNLPATDLRILFENFDEVEKSEFLLKLPIAKRTKLETLMKYDETDAATIMRSNFVRIDKNQTASQAMSDLISRVSDTDFIDDVFVVEDNILIGYISLKDIIIARKNDSLEPLIKHEYQFVKEDDKLNLAIEKISNYDIKVLPVLNNDYQLIGIINAEDVLEEMALDFESNIDKFVAVGDFDEDSSPLKRAYQRLPWLLVSIVLNLVIASFLTLFANTIQLVTALVLFQPLILGMAGNIGTQAIAVTILKLHKNNNEIKDINKHVNKEFLIGCVNAVIVGVLGFFLSWIFFTLVPFDSSSGVSVIKLSIVVGLSLVASMILSALFGVLIPIILTKFKIDPAAAAGPVISTINDLVALVIYFGLATLIIIPMIS